MFKLSPSYYWKKAIIAKNPIEATELVVVGNAMWYNQIMFLVSKYLSAWYIYYDKSKDSKRA